MTHGLMFHYFWNEDIRKTQGSIDEKTFSDILDGYAKGHHLICASDYVKKAISGELKENDVCITFDDGLYSQYAVAEPVLKKKGLTAFFFVYTSPLEGIYEKIEIFRAFRNSFRTMDDFYLKFFQAAVEYGQKKGVDYAQAINSDTAKAYHKQYGYYSQNDRVYRYLRDIVLKEEYNNLMEKMMKECQFDPSIRCKNIWIEPSQLVELHDKGNVIGLHSHTHPTTLEGMGFEKKKYEYKHNKSLIENLVGVNSASYPCDTYDEETKEILGSLGIDLAFIAHMEKQEKVMPYRIPRIDAAAIIRQIL